MFKWIKIFESQKTRFVVLAFYGILSGLLNACGSSSSSSSSTSATLSDSAIHIQSSNKFQVKENLPPHSIVGKVIIQTTSGVPTYQLAENQFLGITNTGHLYLKKSLDFETQNSFNVVLTVKNTSFQVNQTLQISVSDQPEQIENSRSDDPLYPHQWYIKNTGLAVFDSSITATNMDLNISSLPVATVNGVGVIVSILDTGLEIKHEDLAVNIDTKSDDFSDGIGGDIDPTNNSSGGHHGTAVAGIIAMRDGNKLGGRGVAPRATIRGFNYLSHQGISNFTYAIGASVQSPKVDIVNLSLGSNSESFNAVSVLKDELIWKQLLSGRNQRGVNFVKAVGNEFLRIDSHQCSFANLHTSSCASAYEDPTNTLPIIVVGAINANGKRSSYSVSGSNIWVVAFGGEYGYAVNRLSSTGFSYTQLEPRYYGAAIISADSSGCNYGKSLSNYGSYIASANDFNYVWQAFYVNKKYNQVIGTGYANDANRGVAPHTLNAQCNYLANFNGTSAAVPMVSGVIALMLQANPQLTFRDVRHILAKTARQVDTSYQQKMTKKSTQTVQISDGWVTNKAGFNFSDWYGFGLVDAAKAVSMSQTYLTNDSANSRGQITSATASHGGNIFYNSAIEANEFSNPTTQTVVSNSVTPAVKSITINQDLFIEHLEIFAEVYTYPDTIRDLKIQLESPSGTKAIIFHPINGLTATRILPTQRMSTNAFYGERSKGTWKLSVIDQFSATDDSTMGDTDGRFYGWKLNVYGH